MKFNLNIFTSKFARRIFFVFFLCALIPVCGLAFIAYQHVSRQLDEQFRTNLKHSVKTYSLFLYERFLILETELTLAAMQEYAAPNTARMRVILESGRGAYARGRRLQNEITREMDEMRSDFGTGTGVVVNPGEVGVARPQRRRCADLDGRPLKVSEARPREDRRGGGGY